MRLHARPRAPTSPGSTAVRSGSATTRREFFLEHAGVALTDGPLCGAAGRGFARLNFAPPRPVLRETVERIAAAMP